ncbi:Oidioi.mRNA.OKI2018_I69.XSR.g14345.t1.cds [Oikopleura dioica]|uniref:Large ribosomal subunit protein uL4m n=1 Tax=Oikopleura dioica TaxID=34765 RepID=A0ABN7S9I3_OIKDI|nr:Oidioi.mRNA.OKI2018_I69.XSR.g14345.t1.cds [Oikopleura dioica]
MLKSAKRIRARLASTKIVWSSASGVRPGKKEVDLELKRSDELLRLSSQSAYVPETVSVYGVTVLETKSPVEDLFETLEIDETDAGQNTPLPETTQQTTQKTKISREVQQEGIAQLHPKIWAAVVDQQAIHEALEWQNTYKTVDMSFEQSRMETGHKRWAKPWGGSGHGYERVRDKTGPYFRGGAFTDEPRRPYISNFHMIDRATRIKALVSCLTLKFIQGDLLVVSSLTNNIEAISKKLNTKKEPELSYLVLNKDNDYPIPLENWIRSKKYYNLFPVEGLNVKSLLKYDKLIIDLETLDFLEKRLLFEIERFDLLESHDEPEHPLLNSYWSSVMTSWKDEKFNQGGYRSGHHKFYKDWPKSF